MLTDQPTAQPSRKITATALAGAIAAVVAWVLEITTSIAMPAPVVAALTTIFAVAVGYFTRERLI